MPGTDAWKGMSEECKFSDVEMSIPKLNIPVSATVAPTLSTLKTHLDTCFTHDLTYFEPSWAMIITWERMIPFDADSPISNVLCKHCMKIIAYPSSQC